jgi:hypothetical protein
MERSVGMARIAHCLSACSFDRSIAMAFGYRHTGFTGAWAKEKDCRKLVNANPSDIVLGEAHSNDPMVLKPVEWIKQQLAALAEA